MTLPWVYYNIDILSWDALKGLFMDYFFIHPPAFGTTVPFVHALTIVIPF